MAAVGRRPGAAAVFLTWSRTAIRPSSARRSGPRSTDGGCSARRSGSGGRCGSARLSIDLGAAVDFARALTLVDIADREQVQAAGAAIFVRRRDDRAVYDAAFDRWWRQRGSRFSDEFQPSTMRAPDDAPLGRGGARDDDAGTRHGTRGDAARRARHPDPGRQERASDDEAPIEGVVISPDAYSQGEVLRHREFDRMTPAELREAERLVDLLVPRLERRRTRRYELHSHGRRLAPRAMFRRNLGTGGQLVVVGLAAPDPRAALARRPVRHLGLDGAPLAAAAALRPGALGRVGGPDRIVRVRDAADPGHAAAARPRPRPGARAGRRFGQRLGGRHADRRVVPDVQPEVGAALAAHVGRRHRRLGRLGPRRPGARRRRDRPAPAQLPPARLAQPAGRHARLPAAGRRDARRLPVHRRLPAGRDRRLARAARRDPGRRSGRRHATRERGGRPRGAPRVAACPTVVGATLRRRW